MKYVYLLRSQSSPDQTYVGATTDFPKRLKHNDGHSPYTARFRPWRPIVILRFDDDARADVFERYLKSGSGHAFAQAPLLVNISRVNSAS